MARTLVKTIKATTTTPSYVELSGYTGLGSTNTQIIRLTTTINNVGTDITYASSASLGDSFTINRAGFVSVTLYGQNVTSSATTGVGWSINSNQLSTALRSITISNILALSATNDADGGNNIADFTATATVWCNVGDVIRPHVSGSVTIGTLNARVTYVGAGLALI